MVRQLAHEPMGWHSTTLEVRVGRYRCDGCGHVWRHTRRGDKYVIVIIDLAPIRDGTGPARLMVMVEGRSTAAFKTRLADRPQTWREAVMDPFHVVRLAGDAPDQYRRRVQQHTRGHRGCKDDSLYWARRTLHTGAHLLTDKQRDRLEKLFEADAHVEVEAT